jgi:hypothetical protein
MKCCGNEDVRSIYMTSLSFAGAHLPSMGGLAADESVHCCSTKGDCQCEGGELHFGRLLVFQAM